jgi:hypothetical protein
MKERKIDENMEMLFSRLLEEKELKTLKKVIKSSGNFEESGD